MYTLNRENRLTPREGQILERIVEGALDKEIATLLHISLATVKATVRTALQRTGSRNRTQLAVRFGRGEFLVARAWDAESPPLVGGGDQRRNPAASESAGGSILQRRQN